MFPYLFAAFIGAALLTNNPTYADENPNIVIRAAIDIGSGATKLRVAEVNLKSHKIERILYTESFAVPYQEELEKSHNNTLSEEVMQIGFDALKKSHDIAMQYNAKKVVAVATAAFRTAANAPEFIQRIKRDAGIDVYVIDQKLEGELAFEAAKAQVDIPLMNLIVWDIGGGSLQLTTLDPKGNLAVFKSSMASVPFKNLIIQNVQKRNPKQYVTPNPMTIEQIQLANQEAKEIAKKVDNFFRNKLSNPNSLVVGVGNIFIYRVLPLVDDKQTYTLSDLRQKVQQLAGLTDGQVSKDSFGNVAISNPILILGYMEELKIPQVKILDINNADGAMLYPAFWEAEMIQCVAR